MTDESLEALRKSQIEGEEAIHTLVIKQCQK